MRRSVSGQWGWWGALLLVVGCNVSPKYRDYVLTADKLNALYAICNGLTPADECHMKVEWWLTDFIQ